MTPNPCFAHINDDEASTELKTLTYALVRNLPARIFGAGTKMEIAQSWQIPKPTIIALKYDKFICFNSKKLLSFAIFDIDEVEYDLQELYQNIINKLDVKPVWLIKTPRGYQFAFLFRVKVELDKQNQVFRLNQIQNIVSSILRCDRNASNRTYGFFRNPLAHREAIFNPEATVEFDDFNHLIKTQTPKPTNTNSQILISLNPEGFIEGRRHSFLFRKCCAITNKHKNNISLDTLYEALLQYQMNLTTQTPKLNDKEIKSIAKSVFNLAKQNKVDPTIGAFVHTRPRVSKRGLLSLVEIHGFTPPKKHKQLVKQRQSESGKQTQMIKKNKAYPIIKKTINYLQQHNIPINNKNIRIYQDEVRSDTDTRVGYYIIRTYLIETKQTIKKN